MSNWIPSSGAWKPRTIRAPGRCSTARRGTSRPRGGRYPPGKAWRLIEHNTGIWGPGFWGSPCNSYGETGRLSSLLWQGTAMGCGLVRVRHSSAAGRPLAKSRSTAQVYFFSTSVVQVSCVLNEPLGDVVQVSWLLRKRWGKKGRMKAWRSKSSPWRVQGWCFVGTSPLHCSQLGSCKCPTDAQLEMLHCKNRLMQHPRKD